jgi:hypothetical protein
VLYVAYLCVVHADDEAGGAAPAARELTYTIAIVTTGANSGPVHVRASRNNFNSFTAVILDVRIDALNQNLKLVGAVDRVLR